MNRDETLAILRAVADGQQTPEAAAGVLQGTVDLGFATVDLDRARRRGVPEVIFAEGKTAAQVAGIARALFSHGQRVLATRVTASMAAEVIVTLQDLPARYEATARCLVVEDAPPPVTNLGHVLVVCAGTTDLPVAEEARLTASMCGSETSLLADVGVAGLHRLLAQLDRLRAAAVLVVVAGMEGALPSVVAGLVHRPVIAVPTSVGYGANLGGLTALLSMLNTCAAGVTVVNIDNGFGAGYAAAQMTQAADDGAAHD